MATLLGRFAFTSVYSALEVANPHQERHGADWTDRHVDQGFAWRPGCVAFGLLADVVPHPTEVRLADAVQPDDLAERAIVVPFTVPAHGAVALSDFACRETVAVPPGDYALLFETGRVAEDTYWVCLTFVPAADARPAILRADDDLMPTDPLLMAAEPL